MSDSENPPSSLPTQSTSHPPTGGKTLPDSMNARPPYKSYRKKYRKMHAKFSVVLEENKRLFKDEQKLEGIARRLREELDGLLELCLDLNQNPALPPHLRFDISLPVQHTAVGTIASVVEPDVTPTAANELFTEYTNAVQRGQIPHLDLHVIREQLEDKLRVQGVQSLSDLESSISHTRPDLDGPLPDSVLGSSPPGLLSSEQEDLYLLRQDAKLGGPLSLSRSAEKQAGEEEKHWADMTAREVERQVELLNPMSQHNWLKTHAKGAAGMEDDGESVAADAKPAPRKRNLAKQVGDRAVGRAREGASPSAASAGGAADDDDSGFIDDHAGTGASGKKKGRSGADVDGTYRVKGGKNNNTNGSATKKRKRPAGEEAGAEKKSKLAG